MADDEFDQPPEWLLGAARIAQEYVDNPAVVAAMDAAQRITPLMKDIQARADAMETVRSTLEHLANFNSVASVLERQRSAMTEIAFRLRGPVPQTAELEQAEATILNQRCAVGPAVIMVSAGRGDDWSRAWRGPGGARIR